MFLNISKQNSLSLSLPFLRWIKWHAFEYRKCLYVLFSVNISQKCFLKTVHVWIPHASLGTDWHVYEEPCQVSPILPLSRIQVLFWHPIQAGGFEHEVERSLFKHLTRRDVKRFVHSYCCDSERGQVNARRIPHLYHHAQSMSINIEYIG